jgi:hypothetical protein
LNLKGVTIGWIGYISYTLKSYFHKLLLRNTSAASWSIRRKGAEEIMVLGLCAIDKVRSSIATGKIAVGSDE